jgi:hypothetical protein
MDTDQIVVELHDECVLSIPFLARRTLVVEKRRLGVNQVVNRHCLLWSCDLPVWSLLQVWSSGGIRQLVHRFGRPYWFE